MIKQFVFFGIALFYATSLFGQTNLVFTCNGGDNSVAFTADGEDEDPQFASSMFTGNTTYYDEIAWTRQEGAAALKSDVANPNILLAGGTASTCALYQGSGWLLMDRPFSQLWGVTNVSMQLQPAVTGSMRIFLHVGGARANDETGNGLGFTFASGCSGYTLTWTENGTVLTTPQNEVIEISDSGHATNYIVAIDLPIASHVITSASTVATDIRGSVIGAATGWTLANPTSLPSGGVTKTTTGTNVTITSFADPNWTNFPSAPSGAINAENITYANIESILLD